MALQLKRVPSGGKCLVLVEMVRLRSFQIMSVTDFMTLSRNLSLFYEASRQASEDCRAELIYDGTINRTKQSGKAYRILQASDWIYCIQYMKMI